MFIDASSFWGFSITELPGPTEDPIPKIFQLKIVFFIFRFSPPYTSKFRFLTNFYHSKYSNQTIKYNKKYNKHGTNYL